MPEAVTGPPAKSVQPPEVLTKSDSAILASAVSELTVAPAGTKLTITASPPAFEDTFAALKSIAEIAGLMGVLAFTAGWSYMASYYMAFGLNPMELDFSVQATAAFALHMLVKSAWPLMVAVALLVLLVVFNAKLGAFRRMWVALAVTVLLMTVALAGAARGREHAGEDMLETSPRLPSVALSTKPDLAADNPTLSKLSCINKNVPACKLLLRAKGVYYLFLPLKSTASNSDPKNLNLYALPEGEVTAVHAWRGVE